MSDSLHVFMDSVFHLTGYLHRLLFLMKELDKKEYDINKTIQEKEELYLENLNYIHKVKLEKYSNKHNNNVESNAESDSLNEYVSRNNGSSTAAVAMNVMIEQDKDGNKRDVLLDLSKSDHHFSEKKNKGKTGSNEGSVNTEDITIQRKKNKNCNNEATSISSYVILKENAQNKKDSAVMGDSLEPSAALPTLGIDNYCNAKTNVKLVIVKEEILDEYGKDEVQVKSEYASHVDNYDNNDDGNNDRGNNTSGNNTSGNNTSGNNTSGNNTSGNNISGNNISGNNNRYREGETKGEYDSVASTGSQKVRSFESALNSSEHRKVKKEREHKNNREQNNNATTLTYIKMEEHTHKGNSDDEEGTCEIKKPRTVFNETELNEYLNEIMHDREQCMALLREKICINNQISYMIKNNYEKLKNQYDKLFTEMEMNGETPPYFYNSSKSKNLHSEMEEHNNLKYRSSYTNGASATATATATANANANASGNASASATANANSTFNFSSTNYQYDLFDLERTKDDENDNATSKSTGRKHSVKYDEEYNPYNAEKNKRTKKAKKSKAQNSLTSKLRKNISDKNEHNSGNSGNEGNIANNISGNNKMKSNQQTDKNKYSNETNVTALNAENKDNTVDHTGSNCTSDPLKENSPSLDMPNKYDEKKRNEDYIKYEMGKPKDDNCVGSSEARDA
ncbi:uncharacterized protein MKS88_000045 [Plasmodium brasilianum]|uniref:Inhibitor of growth protein N-terminal histone-binding domain-containing protein n=1 Tax=Plasmodium malariae TaxID=5858 RepID=A0A1D3JHK6_PLAMA|nr:conserved Plasmodium protein, unknown function [Plasmodium malariae]KAI4841507.1 hypothetical protein MKS88_000045 [Plasmodium brasilianum]SBT85682.1 conserved Plasmodium protein, unknown function [Plasmodium malariae]